MPHIRKHSNRKVIHTWFITHGRLIFLVFILLFLFDISPLGGNIRFYAKWIECGQKPVVAGMTYETEVPHYVAAPAFPGPRLTPAQFCSPHDAEMHGYSANPDRYEFDHTTQQERYNSPYQQQN